MTTQSNNSVWKWATGIMALLLAGNIAYNFTLKQEQNNCNQEVVKITSEKEQLKNELKEKISEYDLAISENTSLKGDLEKEKEKMVALLGKLEKAENTAQNVKSYKNEFLGLKKQMDVLMKENHDLVAKNEVLTKELDSTKVVATNIRKEADTLATKNLALTSTVAKAKKLVISDVNAMTFKKKSSGKLKETDKASRANTIKVIFTIIGNEIADKGERKYYTQIIDPNNNVLGEKKVENFGEKELNYSYINMVNFDNKTQSIEQELPVEEVTSGLYAVNIFDDKGILVGNAKFELK